MKSFESRKSQEIRNIGFAAIMALLPACFTDYGVEISKTRRENAQIKAEMTELKDRMDRAIGMVCGVRSSLLSSCLKLNKLGNFNQECQNLEEDGGLCESR